MDWCRNPSKHPRQGCARLNKPEEARTGNWTMSSRWFIALSVALICRAVCYADCCPGCCCAGYCRASCCCGGGPP
ncbi:hypothetical protein HDK64DRAFT_87868 [Phyllosticta capitalensis]